MLDLDMSPYAAFVWPAWAVTAAVLSGLVARAVLASRRWRAELKRLESEHGDLAETLSRAPIVADRSQATRSAPGPQA